MKLLYIFIIGAVAVQDRFMSKRDLIAQNRLANNRVQHFLSKFWPDSVASLENQIGDWIVLSGGNGVQVAQSLLMTGPTQQRRSSNNSKRRRQNRRLGLFLKKHNGHAS